VRITMNAVAMDIGAVQFVQSPLPVAPCCRDLYIFVYHRSSKSYSVQNKRPWQKADPFFLLVNQFLRRGFAFFMEILQMR
jgi:hypothetical protein